MTPSGFSHPEHTRLRSARLAAYRPLRPGLTLAEMVVSMILVGIMLVAALNVAGGARRSEDSGAVRRRALILAQDLMSEILEQDYADPNEDPNVLGMSAAESSIGDRSLFNDVDDYKGWKCSPPQCKNGATMTNLDNWQRSVHVVWVDPNDVSNKIDYDQGSKRITVKVKCDGIVIQKLRAVRTAGLPSLEACCLDDGTCVDLRSEQCDAAGGKTLGPNTSCATTTCPPAGLIAYWNMDDGLGEYATDAVGDWDGWIRGAAWTSGVFNGALRFDGYNDFVVVLDKSGPSPTEQMTLAAWINKSFDKNGRGYILNKGSPSSNQNYYLAVEGTRISFGFYDGGPREFVTDTLLDAYTWYHLAATFDNATNKVCIYLNGVEVLSTTTTAKPTENTEDSLYIGREYSPTGDYWQGILDDVRVYERALSAGEIADLYATEP